MRPIQELGRYFIVGIILNICWYGLYLLLTSSGLHPAVVVAVFFPPALLASYHSHRKHTFRLVQDQLRNSTLARFIGLNFASLGLNLLLLYVLTVKMGAPHQVIQVIAMGVCAIFLFVGMKIFVFRSNSKNQAPIN